MSAVHLRGLRIEVDGHAVVDGVDLDVAPGECVAIVGESGAGKSLTARALLGMLPGGARMTVDELRVDGAKHGFSGEIEHVAPRAEFTPRYLFSERERPNLVLRVRVRVSDPAAELHAGTPTRVTLERRAGK